MLDCENKNQSASDGLRPAEPADIDFLRSFSDGPPDHVLAAQIRDGRMRIIEEAGRPIGFLKSSVLWETLPFIEVIVVLKSERGHGCGTRAVRLGRGNGPPRVRCRSHLDAVQRDRAALLEKARLSGLRQL